MRLYNRKEQAFFGKLALIKLIFVSFFFSLFFSPPSCMAKDLSDDDVSSIIGRLDYLVKQVKDEKSRDFVQAVIDDPESLRDDATLERVAIIWDRVELWTHLDFVMQGGVGDDEIRRKVEAWRQNPLLLDDLATRREAVEIIRAFQEKSKAVMELLQKLYLLKRHNDPDAFSGDPERKALVERWMNDPANEHQVSEWLADPMQVVCDLAVQEEVRNFLDGMLDPNSAPKESSGAFRLIKNLGMTAYWAYRKLRFLEVLDTGVANDNSGWFSRDNLFALSFLVSEEWERNKDLNIAKFLGMQLMVLPLRLFEWSDAWGDIVKDKASRYVRGATNAAYSDIMLRAMPQVGGGEDVFNQHLYDAVGLGVGAEVRLNGFAGRNSLDFYFPLDREVDVFLKGQADRLFEKAHVPAGIRNVFWKSRLVAFLRQTFVCKFLPTYLYLKWRNHDGDEDGSRRFYKEAAKSTFDSLKYCALRYVVKKLDGKKDGSGRGFLSRMKDRTLGIVSPNLIFFMLKELEPRAAVSISNSIHHARGGDDDFLSLRGDYTIQEEPGRAFTRSLTSYLVRAPCYYVLVKLLQKYRPMCFGWLGKKMTDFCGYLANRGWISKDLWNELAEVKKELEAQGGSLGMFANPLVMLWYLSAVKDTKMRLSEFDRIELDKECRATGDNAHFFDGVLAHYISSMIGRRAARMLT